MIRPLVEETNANERRLGGAPDAWRRWWEQHGARELRCILMTAWDPVGASDVPEAWDEYDQYAAGVAHRLRDIPDADEAAAGGGTYLEHIERDYIGVTPNVLRCAYLGDALVAWYEWSFTRRGRPPQEWIDED